MSKVKRYETIKSCEITTTTDKFFQVFDSSMTYTDIKQWMLDTYCIDESSIVEIVISYKTFYKTLHD